MKQGQLMESDTAAEPGALGKSRSDNRQTQTRETTCEPPPTLLPLPWLLRSARLSPRSEEFLRLALNARRDSCLRVCLPLFFSFFVFFCFVFFLSLFGFFHAGTNPFSAARRTSGQTFELVPPKVSAPSGTARRWFGELVSLDLRPNSSRQPRRLLPWRR